MMFLYFAFVFFSSNGEFSIKIKNTLVFASFFLVFESFWIGYNYKRFNEIIFISKTSNYKRSYEDLYNYLVLLELGTGSKINLQNLKDSPVTPIVINIPPFPEIKLKPLYKIDILYTKEFNDSVCKNLTNQIKATKHLFNSGLEDDKTISDTAKKMLIAKKHLVFAKMNKIINSIKIEHPFYFYFLGRLSNISNYISQDLNKPTFSQEPAFYAYKNRNKLDLCLKNYWNFSYTFVFILAIFGIFFNLISFRKIQIFYAIIALYLYFISAIVWIPEWRYVVTAYPIIFLNLGLLFSKKNKVNDNVKI